MNKTQRNAWFMLIAFSGFAGLSIKGLVGSLRAEKMPLEPHWMVSFYLVLMVFIILAERKRKPKEVEADERDKWIRGRAAHLTLHVLWFLFAVPVIFGPRGLGVGVEGSVPVQAVQFTILATMCIGLAVYAAGILIQYARGGKENE